MTWAASLTRAGIADYLAETYDFDARLHGAYALLMMRYSLSGPIPNDHRRLADICRVSKGLWSNRIWPVLQDFFTLGDDGLIHHEGLDALDTASAVQARRSAAGKKAARQRWDEEAARKAAAGATAHAKPDATGDAMHATEDAIACESHTQSHAISMPDASETHRNSDAIASPIASVASTPRVSPLASSSLLPVSQPVESREENKEEGTGGVPRASAPEADATDATGDALGDATHAPSHTNGDATHASSHANGRANGAANPAGKVPRYALLPDDWQPTTDAVAAMRAMGHDPDFVARKFRLWCLDSGKRSKDHNAAFELFYLNEDSRAPRSPMRSIPGGKPASLEAHAQSRAEIMQRMEAAEAARRGEASDPDDGSPIIEGVAL